MWCFPGNVNDFVGVSGPNRYLHSFPFSCPTYRGEIEGKCDSSADFAEATYKSDVYSFFAHLNREEAIMGSSNRYAELAAVRVQCLTI